MDIKIKSFPASNGESFFIKLYGESVTNILIDCGYVSTTEFIIEELKEIKKNNEKLDLIVLTHIDNDHINGARDLLKYLIDRKVDVGEIWYNDYLKIIDKNYAEKKIPDDIECFINSLMEVEYKNEPGVTKKEKIGFNSATCIAEYLIRDELYSKWNKSFNQSSVYVERNNLRGIKINDEVTITVLGPNKSILDDILKEWESYLIKYANGEIKVKNVNVAKAFEKYFVTLRNVSKKIERSKCSSGSIEDMLEYSTYDDDIINRSSISIAIEFKGKKLLFLGDSSPIDIQNKMENYFKNSINKCEIIKIPHHGSKNNLSRRMIEMVDCERYLISTNGKKFKHPDAEAIAKILFLGNNKKKIYFNYNPTEIINIFLALGKDISDFIKYKNVGINDKDILIIDL